MKMKNPTNFEKNEDRDRDGENATNCEKNEEYHDR